MQKAKNDSFYTLTTSLVPFIWGFGFIVTVEALDAGYSESFILMIRFVIAALVFGIFCLKDIKYIDKNEMRGGIICGFLLFTGFVLQTFALPLTTPSNNAILTAANIVMVPFFVWIVFKQRPQTKIFVSALICFIGIVVLSVDFRDLAAFNIGDILTFMCAVCFALHTAIMASFAVRGRANVLNFVQMTVAAILSIALFLITDRDFAMFVPQKGMIWVLYLAFFSTVVAYFIQTAALKRISASRVAIITSAESLVASIISVAAGYEGLKFSLVLGGILVFISILIVEINPKIKTV